MNRVLITGAAGFVGRHLTTRLLDMGVHVTMIDNLSTGLPPMQWLPVPEPPMTFHEMDVRDYFREAGAYGNFDTVFHCAAVVGGRLKIDGDPIAVAADLAIDAELFQWAVRQRKEPKIVYFSSSAAYPIAYQREAGTFLTETMIDFHKSKLGMPDMTYGWAKLTGEFLAQHAAKRYDLDVVCYRPFSGYGSDQDLTYPFPAIIKRVLNGENPITIWGSGKQQRDFIHIEDCVSCVLATMDKLSPGEALNIGTGIPTSFLELAALAVKVCGRSATIKNDPSKPEGVFSRVADPWKMNQWFKPAISLEQGVLRALTDGR